MARRDREVSPRAAARILECNKRTVYRWCEAAVAGEVSRLSAVRRDATGHYWIREEEVRSLKVLLESE